MLRMLQKHASALGLWVLAGTGLSGAGYPQQQADYGSAPEFWLLLLLIVIFLAILAWWALSRRPVSSTAEPPASRHATPANAQAAPAVPVEMPLPTPPQSELDLSVPPPPPSPEPPGPTPPETEEEPAPADEAAAAPGVISATPSEPDDLRRIEGIGPKVEGALHALGITTYAQLAASDPAALEEQIRAGGVRVLPGAPQTWPEQAALAAKGDWEGFDKLTAALKGGRRSK